MEKNLGMLFFIILIKILICKSKQIEGYFEKMNGINANKEEKNILKCASQCLKIEDCKILVIINNTCSIKNEYASINHTEKDIVLKKKKKFKNDYNLTGKIIK